MNKKNISSFNASYSHLTGEYFLINFSTGASFLFGNQKIDASLSIHNLFDIVYYDHLSTVKQIGFYNTSRNIVFNLYIPF